MGRQANGAVLATMGETVGGGLACLPRTCARGVHAHSPSCAHQYPSARSHAHRRSPATARTQVIYTTACCAEKPSGDGSFVPLTVNYQERFSAAGKTRCGARMVVHVRGCVCGAGTWASGIITHTAVPVCTVVLCWPPSRMPPLRRCRQRPC